ncbi:hypothetical protein Peur_055624 [Populus x canadensis]
MRNWDDFVLADGGGTLLSPRCSFCGTDENHALLISGTLLIGSYICSDKAVIKVSVSPSALHSSESMHKKRLKHQNHLGKNKEGVNFMLYYQSGGPKNKGEVLEDENRMILLRLPKKVGC